MVHIAKTMTVLRVVCTLITLLTPQWLLAEPIQAYQDDHISCSHATPVHNKKAESSKTPSKKSKKRSLKKRKNNTSRTNLKNKKHHTKKDNTETPACKDNDAAPKKPSLNDVRHNIIASAKKFLLNPYLGGKQATAQKGTKKSKLSRGRHIDCSELVQRAYASNNLPVPRTARMQFAKCFKITDHVQERLKPADLIFTAHAKRPHQIDHVMLYMGNGILIESTGAHGKVRIIPIKRRSGKFLSQLPHGKRSGKFFYYYGTFFKRREKESVETDSATV